VSRCDDHPGFVQAKPFGDVLSDSWGCRCRKGKRRRIAQTFAGIAEAEVGGPEVVPPLGDAVSLVDAEEGWLRALDQGCSGDRLECLGCREDDQAATFLETFKCLPSLGGAQPAVKRNDRDAELLKRALLIDNEGMSGEITIVGCSKIIDGTW
jgi:hypothetical protein